MKKIGFIGSGNMARAIMGGIIKKGLFRPEEIMASDIWEPARERTQKELGVEVVENDRRVADESEMLVLAIKPQFYMAVIDQINDRVRADQIVISLAPGWTKRRITDTFGRKLKLVRTMPNTPALALEGITAVSSSRLVTKEELDRVLQVINSFGKAVMVDERLFDAVVAVSGSSPAYVFIMIEAMADAAVLEGMPRAQAYEFAAQAVYGSAKMVLETGKHPAELKDMVCSPAGTTIEAVRALEEKGFRSSIIEAMKVCAKKSREL